MKRLTLIITILFASNAYAGDVSMSSASHLPAEEVAMASGNAAWIVPLIAISLIALAAGSSEPEPDKRDCKFQEQNMAAAPICR